MLSKQRFLAAQLLDSAKRFLPEVCAVTQWRLALSILLVFFFVSTLSAQNEPAPNAAGTDPEAELGSGARAQHCRGEENHREASYSVGR